MRELANLPSKEPIGASFWVFEQFLENERFLRLGRLSRTKWPVRTLKIVIVCLWSYYRAVSEGSEWTSETFTSPAILGSATAAGNVFRVEACISVRCA